MAVTFTTVGSKGNGTRIQAPLLADRCMESSSGVGGEKPEVFCKRANIVSSAESRIVL